MAREIKKQESPLLWTATAHASFDACMDERTPTQLDYRIWTRAPREIIRIQHAAPSREVRASSDNEPEHRRRATPEHRRVILCRRPRTKRQRSVTATEFLLKKVISRPRCSTYGREFWKLRIWARAQQTDHKPLNFACLRSMQNRPSTDRYFVSVSIHRRTHFGQGRLKKITTI